MVKALTMDPDPGNRSLMVGEGWMGGGGGLQKLAVPG